MESVQARGPVDKVRSSSQQQDGGVCGGGEGGELEIFQVALSQFAVRNSGDIEILFQCLFAVRSLQRARALYTELSCTFTPKLGIFNVLTHNTKQLRSSKFMV